MMERTVEIEKKLGGAPSLLDLWKGTDLRRTIITCLMYASQNFAGNLIANQATFFFERKLLLAKSQARITHHLLRGRHKPQLCFPAQSNQLLPAIRGQRPLLVP